MANNKIMVKYDQPGKFLWFLNSSLDATAVVDENGEVSIKLPWYSFLFSKNTNSVKLSIAGQLEDNELTVSGNAEGLEVRQDAKKVNIVTSAVSISVSN